MITFLLILIAISLLWRPVLILVLLVVLMMMLSGCATIRSSVPQQLLTCSSQPASPADPTQRDVGLYVIDLTAAGDDCRTKLNTVRGLLEDRSSK